MRFIHFINTDLKEIVLREGLSLKPNYRNINRNSTGIFCFPLIRIPFKAPVIESEYEDINDFLAFKKEEELLNTSLSIEESWEIVGASRVTRRDPKVKKVSAVIFKLNENHWPITVFINIGHVIGNDFAKILESNLDQGIIFEGYENSLLKLIQNIESERYVIVSAPFTVYTEKALLSLIDKFTSVGGGIWTEDSFECMLTKKISGDRIERILELENKYHTTLLNKK